MQRPSTLKRAGVVLAKLLLLNVVATVAFAASLDLETVLAALICSAIALPSILLYAVLDAFRRPHSYVPEIAYFGSLIPFSIYAAWGAFIGPEGQDLAALILGLYVLPSLFALGTHLLSR